MKHVLEIILDFNMSSFFNFFDCIHMKNVFLTVGLILNCDLIFDLEQTGSTGHHRQTEHHPGRAEQYVGQEAWGRIALNLQAYLWQKSSKPCFQLKSELGNGDTLFVLRGVQVGSVRINFSKPQCIVFSEQIDEKCNIKNF